MRLRNFGPRNLTSGAIFGSRATILVKTQVAYRINSKWRRAAEALNRLNRCDHDIDCAKEFRIAPAAPSAFTGVFHPVEPLQARFWRERFF